MSWWWWWWWGSRGILVALCREWKVYDLIYHCVLGLCEPDDYQQGGPLIAYCWGDWFLCSVRILSGWVVEAESGGRRTVHSKNNGTGVREMDQQHCTSSEGHAILFVFHGVGGGGGVLLFFSKAMSRTEASIARTYARVLVIGRCRISG